MDDPEQREARRIIETLKQISGLTYSGLAIKAGLRPSTVTRPMKNDKDFTSAISLRTALKLAGAAGVRLTIQNPDERADPEIERWAATLRGLPDKKRAVARVFFAGLAPQPEQPETPPIVASTESSAPRAGRIKRGR